MFNLKFDDKVLHNYLLALYASIDEKKLEEFLDLKRGDEEDDEEINYDPKYILRICSENPNLKAASVLIYTKIGLLEDAIDLALTFNVHLAKKIADKTSDEELQRKLWLKIAEKVVSNETDMRKVTEFLNETNDLLQIADILPFFPDFTSISHFKDAICESLEVYHSTITNLKEEMKEAAENLKEIKNEVEALKKKHSVVRTCNNCDLCDEAILLKPFHVFPCNHLFHSDCLLSAIQPHLRPQEVKRVEDIQRMLNPSPGNAAREGKPSSSAAASFGASSFGASSAPTSSATAFGSGIGGFGTTAASIVASSTSKFTGPRSQPVVPLSISEDVREKLVTEMDDLIASECFYCGEIMISTIDQPFVNKMSTWNNQEESLHSSDSWD